MRFRTVSGDPRVLSADNLAAIEDGVREILEL
jgi:hypothetical protein